MGHILSVVYQPSSESRQLNNKDIMTSTPLLEETFGEIINLSAPANVTSEIGVNYSQYISKTNRVFMGLIYSLGRIEGLRRSFVVT